MSPRPAFDPATFQASRLVRELNHAAIACSVAACTGVVITRGFAGSGFMNRAPVGLLSALSTVVYAYFWARITRDRRRHSAIGWILSVPVAALNAGTAFALVVESEDWRPFEVSRALVRAAESMASGATVGVIIWGPALIACLLAVGVPISLAIAAASQGVGGEDRGERALGLVVAGLGAIASAIVAWGGFAHEGDDRGNTLLAAAGIVCGVSASVIAHRRVADRRRLVRAAQSDDVSQWRIDKSLRSRVLVRVEAPSDAYRDTCRATALAELDERGEPVRLLVHERGG